MTNSHIYYYLYWLIIENTLIGFGQTSSPFNIISSTFGKPALGWRRTISSSDFKAQNRRPLLRNSDSIHQTLFRLFLSISTRAGASSNNIKECFVKSGHSSRYTLPFQLFSLSYGSSMNCLSSKTGHGWIRDISWPVAIGIHSSTIGKIANQQNDNKIFQYTNLCENKLSAIHRVCVREFRK